jgi:hypothetical protein
MRIKECDANEKKKKKKNYSRGGCSKQQRGAGIKAHLTKKHITLI